MKETAGTDKHLLSILNTAFRLTPWFCKIMWVTLWLAMYINVQNATSFLLLVIRLIRQKFPRAQSCHGAITVDDFKFEGGATVQLLLLLLREVCIRVLL